MRRDKRVAHAANISRIERLIDALERELLSDCKRNLKTFRVLLEAQVRKRHGKQITSFKKLKRISPASIFDPFDYRLEQLHSDYLAWLLDPRGSHGLAGEFGRIFLRRVTKIPGPWKVNNVAREVSFTKAGRVDLLLDCHAGGKKNIVIIENKILSSLGKNQLQRYERSATERFKMAKVFLLLAPRNTNCECFDPWKKISYLDIAAVLLLSSIAKKSSNILLAPYALGLLEKLEEAPISTSGLVCGSTNMIDFFEPEAA